MSNNQKWYTIYDRTTGMARKCFPVGRMGDLVHVFIPNVITSWDGYYRTNDGTFFLTTMTALEMNEGRVLPSNPKGVAL